METEERDQGTTKAGQQQDNVVRLPRDWIGPRDELVPFGPRAWGEEGDGVPAEGATLAPADFWSENSNSLHDAVQGPLPSAGPRPAIDDSAPAPAPARTPRWRGFPAALAAMLVILIGVAVTGLLSAGSPTPGAQLTGGSVTLLAGLPATGHSLALGIGRMARGTVTHAARRPARRARRRAAHHRPRSAAAIVVVASSSPRYSPASVESHSATNYVPAASSSSVSSGPAASSAEPVQPAGPSQPPSVVGCNPKCS